MGEGMIALCGEFGILASNDFYELLGSQLALPGDIAIQYSLNRKTREK